MQSGPGTTQDPDVASAFALPPASTALSLFLGSVRTEDTWGIGDFGALARLSGQAARMGFDLVALGPIAAVPFAGEVSPSPYSPSSRLWFNISYVDVPRVPGFELIAEQIDWDRVRRLNRAGTTDPTAVRDLKLDALRRIFTATRPSAELDAGTADRRHLTPYSIHGALSLHLGPDWRAWPAELRSPASPQVERWADAHRDDVAFIRWCVSVVEEQLHRAARAGCDLVLDLPVATPHDSADAWLWQESTALRVDLGAPPDYIDPTTSRWPLAPFDPSRLAALDFEPLASVLDAHLTHGRGLRIDHAYGLFRQYWLDHAGEAEYFVPQPTAELLRTIAQVARDRAGWVVMEELGPEPPGAEATLRSERLLSQRPFVADQFDPRCRETWVGISSHDLPTLGAYVDPTSQKDEWILNRSFFDRARAKLRALVPDLDELAGNQVAGTVLRAIDAAYHPHILCCALDDVTGDPRPYNLPGTGADRHPNFVRAYPTLHELETHPAWDPVVDLLAERRTR